MKANSLLCVFKTIPFLWIFGIGLFQPLLSQKPFQGKIIFEAQVMDSVSPEIQSYFERKAVFTFKKRNSYVSSDGQAGALVGDILVKKGVCFVIRHNAKEYFKVEPELIANSVSILNVEPQNEVIEILGYDCRKYLVHYVANDGSAELFVWNTTELKIKAPKGNVPSLPGSNLSMQGIEGQTLKRETRVTLGETEFTMIEIATEINRQRIKKKFFSIPDGYLPKMAQ